MADKRQSPALELEKSETAAKLQEVLASLPKDDQQIVGMKFFLRRTNRDIAAAMNLTPSNVGVRLFRILRQMRNLMMPIHSEPVIGGSKREQFSRK